MCKCLIRRKYTRFIKIYSMFISVCECERVYSPTQYMNSTKYSSMYHVTIKGNKIELERILTTFSTIDFSNNRFEGVIPAINHSRVKFNQTA